MSYMARLGEQYVNMAHVLRVTFTEHLNRGGREMAASWDEYSDWFFRIVWEQGAEPRVYHFLVDEPGAALEVTQCGRGNPNAGAWEEMSEAEDLYELGQVCPDCAMGLGEFAARSVGMGLRSLER